MLVQIVTVRQLMEVLGGSLNFALDLPQTLVQLILELGVPTRLMAQQGKARWPGNREREAGKAALRLPRIVCPHYLLMIKFRISHTNIN
jgi:hypothetical protein